METDWHQMLTYIDIALCNGDITDEQWLDQRNEWLVFLDQIENERRENW